MNSFIPDASILGSVFINGISNILTSASSYPKLEINLSNGALFENGSNSQEIEIDSLKYGRTKNYIFNIDISGAEELIIFSRSKGGPPVTKHFSDVTLTLICITFNTNSNTFDLGMVNRQIFRIGANTTVASSMTLIVVLKILSMIFVNQ